MRKEIKAKADELGQFYFPDECNVWARANIEAQRVSSACTKMAEWMQKKMIDKACEWLRRENTGVRGAEFINEFRKAMEE